MVSSITTHVMNTVSGQPASGIDVTLEVLDIERDWRVVGKGTTNSDGRIDNLQTGTSELSAGKYRLTFIVEPFFEKAGHKTLFPIVVVVFLVTDPTQHYHIPVLLGPLGYSTYRGV